MPYTLRFPEGRHKALTFSYDDGVETDIRFIKILKDHGMKGTFNINSGLFAPEGTVYAPGTVHRRMTRNGVYEAYKDSGMEVAVHGAAHPFWNQMPQAAMLYDIAKDRENLENMFGGMVRGAAYPYGTYNDDVVAALKSCGIAYCRTAVATKRFDLPDNWLLLSGTCHHNDPSLMSLAEKFVSLPCTMSPKLFYVWGHTYEFDGQNNWDVIERFTEFMAGREDKIWYATNIEIYDYVHAFKSMITTIDGTRAMNPTTTTLWFESKGRMIKLCPGESVSL